MSRFQQIPLFFATAAAAAPRVQCTFQVLDAILEEKYNKFIFASQIYEIAQENGLYIESNHLASLLAQMGYNIGPKSSQSGNFIIMVTCPILGNVSHFVFSQRLKLPYNISATFTTKVMLWPLTFCSQNFDNSEKSQKRRANR